MISPSLCRINGVMLTKLGVVTAEEDASLEVVGQFTLPLTRIREVWQGNHSRRHGYPLRNARPPLRPVGRRALLRMTQEQHPRRHQKLLRGLCTVNFFAEDHVAAAKWYSELFGVPPYYDSADYGKGPGYLEFASATTNTSSASCPASSRPTRLAVRRPARSSTGTSTTSRPLWSGCWHWAPRSTLPSPSRATDSSRLP